MTTSVIPGLAKTYQASYEEKPLSILGRGTLSLKGFLGSKESIYLSADSIDAFPDSMTAAPLITLVAKRAIELGVSKTDQQKPACFYAPSVFHIATDELTIGSIEFTPSAPEDCTVFCKKLIFANPATAVATQTLLQKYLIGNPQIEIRDARLAPLFILDRPDSGSSPVNSPAVDFATYGQNTYT